jgi:hypothetical protein
MPHRKKSISKKIGKQRKVQDFDDSLETSSSSSSPPKKRLKKNKTNGK